MAKRQPAGKSSAQQLGGAALSPLDELHGRPSFLIRIAHQRAVACFDDECGARLGITNTQYGMLMALAASDGIDVAAAARLVSIDRTTAHVAIRNLHKRGLVNLSVDPDDRRRFLVTISRAGSALLKRGQRYIDRTQSHFLANVTPAERRELVRLLRKVAFEPGDEGFPEG